jgi:hypothetical protein
VQRGAPAALQFPGAQSVQLPLRPGADPAAQGAQLPGAEPGAATHDEAHGVQLIASVAFAMGPDGTVFAGHGVHTPLTRIRDAPQGGAQNVLPYPGAYTSQ